MAILQLTGFEGGDNYGLNAMFGATGGTFAVQGTTRRSGAYALRCNPTGSGTGYASVTDGRNGGGMSVPGGGGEAAVYARFYFMASTLPASGSEEIFALCGVTGDGKAVLRIDDAGQLSLYNSGPTQVGSTGSTALATGTWYRIEVMAEGSSSAAWEVKIDGASEISGSGADFSNGGSNINSWYFGKRVNRNSNSVDFYYDDFCASSSGYPGAGQVALLVPAGAGASSDWTGTYADIDDAPHDSDSTYISTQTVNAASTFTLSALSDAGAINGVRQLLVAGFTGAFMPPFPACKGRVRSGGGNYDWPSSALMLTPTFSWSPMNNGYQKVYGLDPATSAPWTAEGIAALEIGAVCTTGSDSATIHLTQTVLEVDFVPASGGGDEASTRSFCVVA